MSHGRPHPDPDCRIRQARLICLTAGVAKRRELAGRKELDLQAKSRGK
ncbi:MAG: hypothetical protein WAN11_06970 [Syntrophobacteraceae bacterium]